MHRSHGGRTPWRPAPSSACPAARSPPLSVTVAVQTGVRWRLAFLAPLLLVPLPVKESQFDVLGSAFAACVLVSNTPKNLLPRLTSGSSPPVLSSGSFGVSGLHPSLPAIWADFCVCEGERPGCSPPPWPALSSAVSRGRSLPFIWRSRPPVHKSAARRAWVCFWALSSAPPIGASDTYCSDCSSLAEESRI